MTCNSHDDTATFDAATTVSCEDQQKTTTVQVDCTADVHRVMVKKQKYSSEHFQWNLKQP